jgi:hypothetical protein
VNTIYDDVYICTEPATTTPPTRREHIAVVLPFPPPWSRSWDAPAAVRRTAMCFTCLCAGLRAAELPSRDGSELLGHSCPCARHRRVMNLSCEPAIVP